MNIYIVVVSFIGSKNIKELKQNSQKATKLTYPWGRRTFSFNNYII
jgi:hypothetical protein